MSSNKQQAAMKVARAVRAREEAQVIEARRELAAANIEAEIERARGAVKELTFDQIKHLSGLLDTFEMLPVSRFARVRPTPADLEAARRWRRQPSRNRPPGSSNRPEDHEAGADS